jgi:hypothetical protein
MPCMTIFFKFGLFNKTARSKSLHESSSGFAVYQERILTKCVLQSMKSMRSIRIASSAIGILVSPQSSFNQCEVRECKESGRSSIRVVVTAAGTALGIATLDTGISMSRGESGGVSGEAPSPRVATVVVLDLGVAPGAL